jgi:hypothetical protein
MTFLPIENSGAISPFAEWYTLRDELVPLIGERVFSLFALAICEESGGAAAAAHFRQLLVDSGNDVADPQVTETERLLIDFGRRIARDPRGIAADRSRFERATSPRLRVLLVQFAALMIATNIVDDIARVAG